MRVLFSECLWLSLVYLIPLIKAHNFIHFGVYTLPLVKALVEFVGVSMDKELGDSLVKLLYHGCERVLIRTRLSIFVAFESICCKTRKSVNIWP